MGYESEPPPASSSLEEGEFLPTFEHNLQPSGEAPEGMVWIPGGQFSMGAKDPTVLSCCGGPDPMKDARPIHRVEVNGFWMDQTTVTNAQYSRFVRETGYRTVAEQPLDPREFPHADPAGLQPGALVFRPPAQVTDLKNFRQWWEWVPGACWRHPEGRGSRIKGRENHPAVHIAYDDALAYAAWAGKRLPTEAEWEFAARGGQAGLLYWWGNDLTPGGRWMANIWQGPFPTRNTAEDGFAGTAPVGSFPPNPYGLYDMAGNVWQWCQDWYRPDTYRRRAKQDGVVQNPRGPDSSFDLAEPGLAKRITRGGSFLCTDQYCTRYMVGTRGKSEPSSGACHLGFRCVKDAE
jgi:sulfatase modifying factor 1